MKKEKVTKKRLLDVGFVNNSEYTYTMYFNNVFGYLDELEFFFEPNEEICITFRQREVRGKETDSIFLRNIKYMSELHSFINILTGKE